jgi:hypothetical protein
MIAPETGSGVMLIGGMAGLLFLARRRGKLTVRGLAVCATAAFNKNSKPRDIVSHGVRIRAQVAGRDRVSAAIGFGLSCKAAYQAVNSVDPSDIIRRVKELKRLDQPGFLYHGQ